MSNPTLTRAVLEELLDAIPDSIDNYLEPTNVDVRRLRDDRSEIRPGDEVAFVATVTFRVTEKGARILQKQAETPFEDLKNLAGGDALFEIRADGELVAPNFAIDDEGIEQWLADHYEFAFLLDGVASHAFGPVQRNRARSAGQVPWIRKLNTAAIKDDYIDIDIRVGPAPAPPAPPANRKPRQLALVESAAFVEDDKAVVGTFALRVPTTARLLGRTVRIPLEGCDDHLELVLAFHEPVVGKDPQQPPRSPDKHPKS